MSLNRGRSLYRPEPLGFGIIQGKRDKVHAEANPNAGGQGGFQSGQTAKARSGHRVQSLLVEDMAASCLCRPRKYIVNSDWNNRGIPYTHVSQTVGTTFGELSKKVEKNTRKIRLTGSLTNSTSDFVLKGRGFKLRRKCKKINRGFGHAVGLGARSEERRVG